MGIGLLSLGFVSNNPSWEKVTSGLRESEISCICIHPKEEFALFVGTSKAVYQSNNNGKSYQATLQVAGSTKRVHALYMTPSEPHFLYAATDSGLFMSQDGSSDGRVWEKIFYFKDPLKRQCLAVIADDKGIYLGTGDGFFYKYGNSQVWQRAGDEAVYLISQDHQYLYVGTARELFRFNKANRDIKVIFSLGAREEGFDNEDVEQYSGTNALQQIKAMDILSGETSIIYIATTKGVFLSSNQGESWDRFDSEGLPFEDITSLLVLNQDDLFVGTRKGVFRYYHNQRIPLYKGMETNNVNFLARNNSGIIFAATDKGVFRMRNFSEGDNELFSAVSSEGREQEALLPYVGYDQLMKAFNHEPTISEVQKIAIDYAEVSDKKIKSWRVAARCKALLPTLSVGVDRASSDLYHWDSGANPDTLIRGDDYLDWDASVSWDLSDLVWSTDQTSIDSRSKLMVELREDILDEVTRLYFERRRLQIELLKAQSGVPDSGGSDPRLEKEMRIAELTALIDALTGGEFSRSGQGKGGRGQSPNREMQMGR